MKLTELGLASSWVELGRRCEYDIVFIASEYFLTPADWEVFEGIIKNINGNQPQDWLPSTKAAYKKLSESNSTKRLSWRAAGWQQPIGLDQDCFEYPRLTFQALLALVPGC